MSKSAVIYSGGWEGHSPEASSAFWEKVLWEEDFEVSVRDTLDSLADWDFLSEQDLIVPNWTMGSLEKGQTEGLVKATANGIGIAGFHGGMGDAFRGNVTYQFITGAQFVAHPDDVKKWTVNFGISDDPIVRGLTDFEIESEQYYMLVDPAFEWLAEGTFHSENFPWVEGRKMPVAMKKIHHQSRIFYCSLGHQPHEFEIPQVKTLITRGMLWASR